MVFPGLGHLAQGQTRRGILIGAGILGLFVGGIFIGGIDVVDRQEDGLWFMAQAMVGPVAFGVDYVHQHHFKVLDPGNSDPKRFRAAQPRSAMPGEIRDPDAGFFELKLPIPAKPDPVTGKYPPPPNIKSLAKVNELGTLFSAVAGMMNIIVLIDAAFPRGRRPLEATTVAAGGAA